MTYLITPYRNAIRLHPQQHYLVYDGPDYAVVQTSTYHGGSCDLDISPRFVYEEFVSDDCTIEDAKAEAVFFAVDWLEDFLCRVHANPAVIHCTTDGEMFVS